MHRKKKIVCMVAVSGVIMVFIGMYLVRTTSRKHSEHSVNPRETVRLGLPLTPMLSLAIMAEEQGFFLQAGLDVIVLEYPSGKRALAEGLFAGNVDIAGTASAPIPVKERHSCQDLLIVSPFAPPFWVRFSTRQELKRLHAALGTGPFFDLGPLPSISQRIPITR